jgi:hypothetical protein
MRLAEFQQNLFAELQQAKTLSEGIKIYQNSMRATLFNSLTKIFPACKRLVGEDFFAQLAWDYIDHHPSFSPNLNHYGENFPEWIERFKPAELAYFPELAQLEWHWHKVFYGPNNTAMDFDKLNQAILEQGEDIVFKTAKACRLLSFQFSVNKIWQSCQPEYQGNFNFSIKGPCYLALFQLEHKIRMIELNLAEWTFLSYLSKDLSLVNICEKLQELGLSTSPAEYLPKLCQLQLIHVKNEGNL